MTRTALEMRKLANEKELKEMQLRDNELQRKHESRENWKNFASNVIGGGLRMFKFNMGGKPDIMEITTKDKDDQGNPRIIKRSLGYKSSKRIGRTNDPEFYKRYYLDLSKYLNVPTYHRLGAEYYANMLIAKEADNTTWAVPGIIIIPHIPAIGNEGQYGSSSAVTPREYPINNGLSRMKSQVLKSNSRSNVSYEGSDLGLNIICTADIITALMESGRVLSIYGTYHADNAYLAQNIVTALGFNYDDLDENIATYRKRWTELAAKFNTSIVAPAQLTLFKRKIYLASNIFADGSTGKIKQMYAYKQVFFNKLNDVGDGTEILDVRSLGAMRLSVLLNWIRDAITSIADNPDYQEMYNDLRHAFLDLFGIDTKVPEAPFLFNTDDNNREQIHNIKTLPRTLSGNEIDLTASNFAFKSNSDGYLVQGNNGLPFSRTFRFLKSGWNSKQIASLQGALAYYYGEPVSGKFNNPNPGFIFNAYKDEITGDDILDYTRGNVALQQTYNDSEQMQYYIYDCGSEIFLEYLIYGFTTDNVFTKLTGASFLFETNNIYEDLVTEYHMLLECMISKFDWHPLISYVTCDITKESYSEASDCIRCAYTTGDIYHPFFIGINDLRAINEACILSEFFMKDDEFRKPGQ